jgi:integrase/recombinase XerD
VKVRRCVEIYVQRKQACGYSYISIARLLRQFTHFVGNIQISLVRDEHLNAFLGRGHMSNNTWRHHSSILVSFFRYWFARRLITRLPEPKQKPAVLRTFFPYIYTREEIRGLLEATALCQRAARCVFGPETLRTLILFLYGTAMRIDDALALLPSNVNFINSSIQVQDASVHQRRIIPIGSDVKRLLERYLESGERRQFGLEGAIFVTCKGKAIDHGVVGAAFRRLRKIAGVKRANSSSYQPRIQDLRHSFAVHSIERWLRDGHPLHKMLPMLATYLGKVDMQGLERYLELTPRSYETQLKLLSTRHVYAKQIPEYIPKRH